MLDATTALGESVIGKSWNGVGLHGRSCQILRKPLSRNEASFNLHVANRGVKTRKWRVCWLDTYKTSKDNVITTIMMKLGIGLIEEKFHVLALSGRPEAVCQRVSHPEDSTHRPERPSAYYGTYIFAPSLYIPSINSILDSSGCLK